jgi:hypothetical protein
MGRSADWGGRGGEEAADWGLVLFHDLGFHRAQKEGHLNDGGGSLCLSAPLAPGPIRH